MRTKVDIDADVLQSAKHLAFESGRSLGHVLSGLARDGLKRQGSESIGVRNGIPLLSRLPKSVPVTSKAVKELLELG